MQAAFAGVKVLDLSRLLPGPFCSMLLADFGALLGKNSGFHIVLNRNKHSLTLNL